MASTWGRLEAFDKDLTDWTAYCEVVEQYFEANEVTSPAKKTAVLLCSMGSAAYTDLKNAVAPKLPKELKLDEIIATLQKLYEPPTTVSMERFRFNNLSQQANQRVIEFVSALRRQATKCSFGAFLDEALRDRFVCGIRDTSTQKKLLGVEDLTFDKAQKIALSMETAERGASELHNTPQSTLTLNKVSSTQPSAQTVCYCCGEVGHIRPACKHKRELCEGCGKRGHLRLVCRSTLKQSPPTDGNRAVNCRGSKNVKYVVESESDSEELYHVYGDNEPWVINVTLDGAPMSMEVDTGSARSIISESTYHKLWPRGKGPLLRASKVVLRTYTGEKVRPKGSVNVEVVQGGKKSSLPLVVAPGDGPALVGRDWLPHIEVPWPYSAVNKVATEEEFSHLFKDELGALMGVEVSLNVQAGCQPRFFKPRSLPYAMRAKVEAELDRLVATGVLSPIKSSKWATPIVPVLKKDNSVRLCGDYKLTVNKVILPDVYPLPTPEDLFSSLSGGVIFTKLDLSHAYNQLILNDEAKQYLTINTHRGLFRCNRLSFGISSAVAIFQREMENLFRGLPGVAVYLDDILVTGQTAEQHDSNLRLVLQKLSESGLRLKKEKCYFRLPEVKYLGFRVSAKGLQVLDDRVRAITDMDAPTNVTELQSFLGLVTYYNQFLPHLSTVLEPLHKLLRKGQIWVWGEPQEAAVNKVKEMLRSTPVLVHYDPSLPLLLTVDSSSFGLGCVLAHVMKDGTHKPIAFKSRKLSSAERNYSQLDKEALAVLYGVKKFHKYLFGRFFVIHTDHKPLITLLGEGKPVPAIASPRLQRWAITLSAYQYSLKYTPGKLITHADALSRLPYAESPVEDTTLPETVLAMEALDRSLVSVEQLRKGTDQDPVLSKVKLWLREGWPAQPPTAGLAPFFNRQHELSLEGGVILWGSRVVIPHSYREELLDELHEGHPGSTRMKALSRSYVWWPNLDKNIEDRVARCFSCQQEAQTPPQAPLQPWEFPPKPWYRVHMDFAGPVQGRMLLVIVDSYSKWIEVHDMKKITAPATIEKCRQAFATHGLPHTVVTDNGPTFISSAFESFLQSNGVRLVHSSPYHPASNGLAENAVKTVKNGLRKMKSVANLREKLSRFLFRYRITPHTTTGQTPAELLMGRLPRSRLSLVRPDLSDRITMKQSRQAQDHDRRSRARVITVGDNVFVKNFPNLIPRWIPGVVVEQLGPLSFRVQLQTGRVVQRHLDHVRQRLAYIPDDYPREMDDEDGVNDDACTEKTVLQPVLPDPVLPPEVCVSPPAGEPKPESEEEASHETGAAVPSEVEAGTVTSPHTGTPQPRRSSRATKGVPPLRLGY